MQGKKEEEWNEKEMKEIKDTKIDIENKKLKKQHTKKYKRRKEDGKQDRRRERTKKEIMNEINQL